MILCDGKNCQYKWFHFDCVDISTIPHGEWFCKECMAKDD
uniref:Histone-lysine N-methyltransferase NSD-like PHD zinc finger 1 domain-containing protein n=1 Tax=Amphimedon queenslandica TaxID=400682 RepID=A0A1X7VY41_AMPQE